MTPDEALNSVSHAPVINFLAPNLVVGGILFRVCCETLLHELWRPECSFVGTAAQELGGHNSDYVSHNSLLDRVTHAHTPRKTCSRLMRHDPPRLAQAHRRTTAIVIRLRALSKLEFEGHLSKMELLRCDHV